MKPGVTARVMRAIAAIREAQPGPGSNAADLQDARTLLAELWADLASVQLDLQNAQTELAGAREALSAAAAQEILTASGEAAGGVVLP